MNVLAIVAHPDDEVIGCGATLAKLAQSQHDVRMLLTLKRADPRGVENWDALTASFRRACRSLGGTAILGENLIDERSAETHLSDLHDAILPSVEWADIIFSHWPGDVNQVHRGVGRAVEIATRPFRRRKEVYLFEIATSTEQGFINSFLPNSYSLVENDHVQKKCVAMSLYSSELAGPRTPAALERRLRCRGDEIGVEFAECFHLARHFF